MAAARLAAAVLLALAACGDTLVDHRATDLLRPPGGNATVCDPAACLDPDPLPAGAQRACLGAPGSQVCGYECTGGLLKCPEGCCRATRVAAGAAHTCAITSGGALHCWGANGARQVVDVASAAVTAPLRVRDAGVTAVALGAAHTCAIRAGAVECWGSNSSGQAPATVAVPNAVALALGAAFSCALDGEGAVRCWGSNASGQRGGTAAIATPVPSGADAVAAGAEHACALVAGEVRCWGSNASGQLGVPGAGASSATPVAAVGGIGALAAGERLTCAAASVSSGGSIDDALRCWGAGLGSLLDSDPATAPMIPMKDADQSVVRFQVDAVAAGRAHVCVKRDGAAEAVKCLGPDGGAGQLGAPPVAFGETVDVTATIGTPSFASGADHVCAVVGAGVAAGGVLCWGLNSSGQLGDGTQLTPGVDDGRTMGPVPVSGR